MNAHHTRATHTALQTHQSVQSPPQPRMDELVQHQSALGRRASWLRLLCCCCPKYRAGAILDRETLSVGYFPGSFVGQWTVPVSSVACVEDLIRSRKVLVEDHAYFGDRVFRLCNCFFFICLLRFYFVVIGSLFVME